MHFEHALYKLLSWSLLLYVNWSYSTHTCLFVFAALYQFFANCVFSLTSTVMEYFVEERAYLAHLF